MSPGTRGVLAGLIAGGVRLLAGTRLQAGLTPPATNRIYFANHGSNLDFVVIWAGLPAALRARTRPVAAADYWSRGVRSFLARDIFHAVLIARERVSRANNPLEAMCAALDGGADLIIFPEGTRSMDGTMQEFKAGLFHLAKKFPAAELAPVYLENLNRILPKGEILPVPVMAGVRFGRPVSGPLDGEAKRDFLERCRGAVRELGAPV